jgi:hypothetical protein
MNFEADTKHFVVTFWRPSLGVHSLRPQRTATYSEPLCEPAPTQLSGGREA